MKIILDTDLRTDNVISITASSEDASFPATNLQDDFTTNLWKAASGTTATLTVNVSKGSALEIINTNATEMTISVGSGETYEDEAGWTIEDGYEYSADEVTSVTAENLPGSGGRIWVDYSEFSGAHVITIAITAATVPSAGILRAGLVQQFKDPAPGIQEGSADFSIEKELNNGADYFRKRNVVRTFENIEMVETRANAFKLKHDIFDAVGPEPLAIRLFDGANVTDDEFIVFAKRVSTPTIEHLTSTHSRITLSLREVI
jgi:hypothetical protein